MPAKHVQVGHVQVGPVPPHRAPVRGSLGLPVLSQHSVQYVPVHAETPYFQPQLVSVEPNVQAVQLLFKSASSPLLVQQKHFSSHGSVYQATHSQDAPHVLRHYVTKPVLQEVSSPIANCKLGQHNSPEWSFIGARSHPALPPHNDSNPAGSGTSANHSACAESCISTGLLWSDWFAGALPRSVASDICPKPLALPEPTWQRSATG